jgi:hypothetical protein
MKPTKDEVKGLCLLTGAEWSRYKRQVKEYFQGDAKPPELLTKYGVGQNEWLDWKKLIDTLRAQHGDSFAAMRKAAVKARSVEKRKAYMREYMRALRHKKEPKNGSANQSRSAVAAVTRALADVSEAGSGTC